MNTKLLEKIGLNENEANLYLVSLSLGPSSAIQLAKKIGVSRQMIYVLLPLLIEKGLIQSTKIGSKQLYQAADPETLKDIAEKSLEEINKLIPVLKSKQATNSAVPLITVYENPLAMRKWYRKMFAEAKKGDEMLIWSATTRWLSMDEKFYQDYIQKKHKIGIVDRVIAPDTKDAREYMNKMAVINGEWRFDSKHWGQNSELWIWKNDICFGTLRENATNLIVIESADLAAIERYNFENAWAQAKQ